MQESSKPEVTPLADAKPPHPPKGWFSRGYLPHFDAPNTIQHVTIHFADSLPKAALRKMDAEMQALHWTNRDPRRLEKIETWLKAGHGSCVLRDPAIARMNTGHPVVLRWPSVTVGGRVKKLVPK